jgi:Ca2+-binding RTX toxin-like protein
VGAGDLIQGNDGSDIIFGGLGADDVQGNADDDIIFGDHGSVIFDGTGNRVSLVGPQDTGDGDTLTGQTGNDVIFGGVGSDMIGGGEHDDTIVGDEGRIDYTNGFAPVIQTTNVVGSGDGDIIAGDEGNNIVLGGYGGDQITTGGDVDFVVGDQGYVAVDTNGNLQEMRTTDVSIGGMDTIIALGGNNRILGGTASDTITAGDAPDIILGDHGRLTAANGFMVQIISIDTAEGDVDIISSGGGDDIVFGGADDDLINSGPNDDIVLGDSGVANFDATGVLTYLETIDPGVGGQDTINAGDDNDIIFGGAEYDIIHGDAGNDIIFGDNAALDKLANDSDPNTLDLITTTHPTIGMNDDLFGDDGLDYIFGGTGPDVISGGAGHDILLGDHGNYDSMLPRNQRFESIFTSDLDGAGDDTIHGDSGDDFILGQQGMDTIYGGGGQDDVTGGHNVTFGDDTGDVIHGGDDEDVILGDNGSITRELTSTANDVWLQYPAPFNDVVRVVQRFDDLDKIAGDDEIHGDAGTDIVRGQRGDDTITGDGGNDELVGDLGNDTISGGDGHDFMLADVGLIVRAFNDDGSPRVNSNGAWHRDIFLQDVGTLTALVNSSDSTSLPNNLANLLLEADLLIGAGEFNAAGTPINESSTALWGTELLLVDLVAPNNDTLDGGPGEDTIIGQRGNDHLSGGDNDDVIVGDSMRNSIPHDTDIPVVNTGVLLMGVSDPLSVPVYIDSFGVTISTAVTLSPEELTLNTPFNLPPNLSDYLNRGATLSGQFAETLERFDGRRLQPMISIVPDVIRHTELFGSDEIYGDDGDDWLVGDQTSGFSPWVTGLDAVDVAEGNTADAFARIMHTAGDLTLDYERQLQSNGQGIAQHAISVSQDTISGGLGSDHIFGDDAIVIGSFEFGLPANSPQFVNVANEYYDYLRQLEQLAVDVEMTMYRAHHQVLQSMITDALVTNPSRDPLPNAQQFDPDFHDLLIGNDTLAGDGGDDWIAGDVGVFLTTVVTGQRFDRVPQDSKIPNARWTQAESSLDSRRAIADSKLQQRISNAHDATLSHSNVNMAMLPWSYEYELTVGSDNVDGGADNDFIFGDFTALATPVALNVPETSSQRASLDQGVRDLAADMARYLERNHHSATFSELHSQYAHTHYVRGGTQQEVPIDTGSDTLAGGSGDDFIIGDSESALVTYLEDAPGTRYSEPDPEFKVSFMQREDFELSGHYQRNSNASRIGEDEIFGQDGHDILFGHSRDDVVNGGAGDDIVYGGSGANVVNGGTGTNDERAGSTNRPEGLELDGLEAYLFNGLTSFETRLIASTVVGRNLVSTQPTPINPSVTLASTSGLEAISYANGLWRSVHSGTSTAPVAAWQAKQWDHILVGDFNGDGIDDILHSRIGRWYISTSDGSSFTSRVWGNSNPKVGWKNVRVADLNGDGMDDVVGQANRQVRAFISTGSRFAGSQWSTWNKPNAWTNVEVGDFDGDGQADLLRYSAGEWWVSQSTGSEFVEKRWIQTNPARPLTNVVVGDFNGDGKSDVAGKVNRQIRVLLSTGNRFVNQYWVGWHQPGIWYDMTVADLNGDGRDDLVARNGQQLWASMSVGDRFSQQELGMWTTPVTWTSMESHDINEDGIDELFVISSDRLWFVDASDDQLRNRLIGQSVDVSPWTETLFGNFFGV